MDDSDLSDNEILRDQSNPNIYQKGINICNDKKRKGKKHERVYNSYQYCVPCKIKVFNFSQHIERNKDSGHAHSRVPEIKAVRQATNKQEKSILLLKLRAIYNHKFNLRTKERGRGEILLGRRLKYDFDLAAYMPCRNCFCGCGKS